MRSLLPVAGMLFAALAWAGDHMVYETYQDTLSVGAGGKSTLKTLKKIRILDAEGVRLAAGEMGLGYPQSAARKKAFNCKRTTPEGRDDRFFRWDMTRENASSRGFLTDEVNEVPGFSALQEGDVLECTSEIEYDEVDHVSGLQIDGAYPIRARRIEILTASPDSIGYTVVNGEAPPSAQPGRLVWELGPLPGAPPRFSGQTPRDYLRRILIHHRDFNFYGKTYPTRDWPEIAAWIRAIDAPAVALDEGLKQKVSQLTAGAKTDRDRAVRIYDWVRNEHRYVEVALGENGWVPHAAVEVAKNQYGDCKDFSNLFIAMSRAAGLKTATVLVMTRDGGRIRKDFPHPFSFNHEIAAVWLDGAWVFADATHKFLQLGLLRQDIEGLDALLVPDQGDSALINLPASSSDDNHTVWRLTAALENDDARISGAHLRFGAEAGDFRDFMEGAGSSANLYNAMQRWLAREFPGAAEIEISGNYHDINKPIDINIKLRRPNVWQTDEGRRYLQIFPTRFEEDVSSGVPVAGAPIFLGRKHSVMLDVTWNVDWPDLVQLPEPQSLITPFGAFRITAERTGTGFRTYREFSVTRNEISPAEFPAYKAFILKAQELHNQYYDLGPLTGPPPAATAPPAAPGAKPKSPAPKPHGPAAKKPA